MRFFVAYHERFEPFRRVRRKNHDGGQYRAGSYVYYVAVQYCEYRSTIVLATYIVELCYA